MFKRTVTATYLLPWLFPALLTTLPAPATLAADPPSAPPPITQDEHAQQAWIDETVDVRVVNIDARVTDRAGHPVTDLVREDFALDEDGKPVPIVNFAPPTTREMAPVEAAKPGVAEPLSPRPASTPAASAPTAATTILLFDDQNLSGPSRARVIAGLRQQLEAGTLGERVVLVTYDNDGLNVRAPLGAASVDLARALTQLPPPTGLRSKIEVQGMLRMLRDMQQSAYEGGRWDINPPCSKQIAQVAISYASTAQFQARATLSAIAQLLDSLAALPGRKQLLYMTDGLPFQPGLEGFEALRVLCDGTGSRQGLPYSVDVDSTETLRNNPLVEPPSQRALAGATFNLASELQVVSTHANSAGVEMFTLQASGIAAGNSEASEGVNRTSTQEERTAAEENLRGPLTLLASETGGEAVLNTNDFGPAIAEAAKAFHSGYSLGFAPVRAGDDRVHTLRLSTRRSGLTLSYRRSYRDASPATQIAQQLYGSLLHGLWRDPWGVELELQELPSAVVLSLIVPTARLAALPDQAGGSHAALTIFIALRSADGTLTPVRQVHVPVPLPKGRTAASTFVYGIRIKRSPGEHTVALLLRDDLSADTVLLRKQFRIPAS